jgi:hypothetical protein
MVYDLAMEPRLPQQLDISLDLAIMLMDAAVESARRTAKSVLRERRPRIGETLKPGIDTPMWNELCRAVESRLTRYGEQARLARVLGLPRQRVHEMIRARRHVPDGERVLLLLAWLHARNSGRDLL